MSEPPAILIWDGKEIELPIVRGTEGECAIDIAKLRAQTGLITLDYGFVNTGATESAITFIDGDLGILRYRGYDIDDLAEQEHPSFLETAYLLIYGELPTPAQRDEFSAKIRKHTLLHEDVKRFYDGFPKDAHPMATVASVVNALATFYQTSEDPHDPEHVQLSIIRLLAKLPTVAAYAYKKSIGQPFLYPDNSLDLIENFLRMMFAVPSEPYEVSPTIVHALKQLLILHADHEQNCSTSTVRLVGSSDANIYASIAAGADALWGPLHGGANQAAIEMLEDDPRERRRRAGRGRRAPRIPTTTSGSRDSVTASTRTTTRGPASSGARPSACWPSSTRRTRCSTSRSSSSRSRSPTTTSSRRSCTRTSTSTRASSTGRWASPPTCSRCCSRSGACRAGSRTGRNRTRTRRTRSGGPARSTPAPPSASTWRSKTGSNSRGLALA